MQTTWCDNHLDFCKENGLIYNLHNQPVTDLLTFDTLFIVGITWLLCNYLSLSLIGFIVLFVLLLVVNAYIHKNIIGIPTAGSKFFKY